MKPYRSQIKPQYLLILSLLFYLCNTPNDKKDEILNGNLEKIDGATKLPAGWNNFTSPELYDFKVDSSIVENGKYAVSISSKSTGSYFGAISHVISSVFEGHEITLRGYIKTENVTSGYAGLWMRIDGSKVASDNMANQNIRGTTDWREYEITLPYYSESALDINIGALLVGKGKIWFDNLKLYIDGIPIEKAKYRRNDSSKAATDTSFQNNSGINKLVLNNQQIKDLELLGQVWGFVKYYHPAVAKGDINMDAELFRVMPAIINAKNYNEACFAIERWIDKIGVPRPCKNCAIINDYPASRKPEYGEIFDSALVSSSLLKKLNNILESHHTEKNYFVSMTSYIGNPVFQHERPYKNMTYPDAGYRLLSLFRYWNMIQYFYPYKYLIGRSWDSVLREFIPKFIEAKDVTGYELSTLALIGNIHDTHASIWSDQKALENYRGIFAVPFQAKFVENKLTVTGYYNDTLNIKDKIRIGDIIIGINGLAVETLIKKYLPFTPASNYETQLRDMPDFYLLRANNPKFEIKVLRSGKKVNLIIDGILNKTVNQNIVENPYTKKPGYYILKKDIGYLYPGKYHNKDLDAIKKLFSGTKGIIIDMRCYPSEFMPFTFVPFIKNEENSFVKFTKGNVTIPGLFTEVQPIEIKPEYGYKNKVVVIVNEETQSQAEYTTMAFQSSANVTVIGSTTAGADGDVSAIVLPGGIKTMISGLGILYPDGTETQRKGVKIDLVVKPTIAGIKAGRDELLEKAEAIIKGN